MPHRLTLLLSSLSCVVALHCGAAAGGESTIPEPGQPSTSPGGAAPHTVAVGAPEPEDVRPLFERGLQLLRDGRCEEAIKQSFDPIIASFEARFGGSEAAVVCARDAGAGLLQGMLAAAERQGDSVILGPDWPDALYFRAFCEVELGDAERAGESLLRALQLLPDDVLYLAELGHVYQMERDWPRAMQVYRRALEAAETLLRATDNAGAEGLPAPVSPGDYTPSEWVGRSLRGLGYTLVELGELDEAERQYRRALEVNPQDSQAQQELGYIDQLRAGGAP
jgi:tetratricopeptide (TPR) repeat protein